MVYRGKNHQRGAARGGARGGRGNGRGGSGRGRGRGSSRGTHGQVGKAATATASQPVQLSNTQFDTILGAMSKQATNVGCQKWKDSENETPKKKIRKLKIKKKIEFPRKSENMLF